MTEFLGESIQVETGESSPTPVSLAWRGRVYTVTEVLQEWVDTGFGATPPASRTWYNRRHRRYFVVRTLDGEIFKIYLDYKNRRRPTWWLVSRETESAEDSDPSREAS